MTEDSKPNQKKEGFDTQALGRVAEGVSKPTQPKGLQETSGNEEQGVDRVRRRLLKLGLYVAPIVLTTSTIMSADGEPLPCPPALCRPRPCRPISPCRPWPCRPNPCKPWPCRPHICRPNICKPNI